MTGDTLINIALLFVSFVFIALVIATLVLASSNTQSTDPDETYNINCDMMMIDGVRYNIEVPEDIREMARVSHRNLSVDLADIEGSEGISARVDANNKYIIMKKKPDTDITLTLMMDDIITDTTVLGITKSNKGYNIVMVNASGHLDMLYVSNEISSTEQYTFRQP